MKETKRRDLDEKVQRELVLGTQKAKLSFLCGV